MLTGKLRIGQGAEHGLWSAECEMIGAFTQGKGRDDACDMLRALVELQVDRKGFRVVVTEIGEELDGSIRVLVEANDPVVLTANVLRYQRQVHGLTIAQVAKKLGSSNHNAYAAYERAEREPSMSKYRELLRAIAPELRFTIGGELPLQPARRAKRGSKSAGKRKVS
jgi:hypothetical protein